MDAWGNMPHEIILYVRWGGFLTMKIHFEEVTIKPSSSEGCLLIKHYRCSYCKHHETREVVIAKLSTNI